MSIRLRFTLLYNAILLLTLVIFGVVLYSVQAQSTLSELRKDLVRSSEAIGPVVSRSAALGQKQPPGQAPPPIPFLDFSSDQEFQKLPEREVVRVLDNLGNLVASPFGHSDDALPLSAAGLDALNAQQDWWETATFRGQPMLIYSHPLVSDGQITYILQAARPLTERDRSLQALASTLVAVSGVVLLVAFGIGWVLSGITLQPIHRMTQTAQQIGSERDFSRRVTHTGPQDEVGQLATTFNAMLARLQEAYQQVAHSLEMQRNFVADVSHELRTPLTTLRGNLGLLNRIPPIPTEEQTDILNDMEAESDRLIRLVNDLLVLARADAARTDHVGRSLQKEPVDVAPLIEELCRQARQLDPQRPITCQIAAEASFLGDRDAFKQVLLILLDNAIKHSTSAVHISAELAASSLRVNVRDEGPGIPPEKLERVFDRFYRGEDNATIPGFGLGLPIAKALVEGQGGTIAIESEVGKGTALVINLPLTKE